jgi:hypothetical protein
MENMCPGPAGRAIMAAAGRFALAERRIGFTGPLLTVTFPISPRVARNLATSEKKADG